MDLLHQYGGAKQLMLLRLNTYAAIYMHIYVEIEYRFIKLYVL